MIPRASFRALAALADLRDSWRGGALDRRQSRLLGRRDAARGRRRRVPRRRRGTGDSPDGARASSTATGCASEEDRGYRVLRPVMRNRAGDSRRFASLHPDWATRLARAARTRAGTIAPRDEGRGLRDGTQWLSSSTTGRLDLARLRPFARAGAGAIDHAAESSRTPDRGSMRRPIFASRPKRSSCCEWREGSAEGHCLNALDRMTRESAGRA